MFHRGLSLNLVLLLKVQNSVSGSRLELMYLSLVINIRSSLHSFLLLVPLPSLIKSFLFLYQMSKSSHLNSDRLEIVAKGFFKLSKLFMLLKQKIDHFPETRLTSFLANC